MIVDNLELLKKLDPNAWAEIDKWLDRVNTLPETDHGQWIVQGCLQRAITARGWALQQFQYAGGEKRYAAGIFPIRGMFEGGGDSPAAALLAAYLEAMQ